MFPAKKDRSDSIRCHKNCGPQFGIDELEAYSQPFNEERACISWSWNNSGCAYNIGVDSQGRNLLTNQLSKEIGSGKVCWFTITELEVWKVKLN